MYADGGDLTIDDGWRAHVPVAGGSQVEVAERFFLAARTGDVQQRMDLRAPDVVLLSNGGGRARAALRPVPAPGEPDLPRSQPRTN